jgi:hypothetical protein
VNDTITAMPGVEVGHWTDAAAETGCTVVVLPEPNVVPPRSGGPPLAPGSTPSSSRGCGWNRRRRSSSPGGAHSASPRRMASYGWSGGRGSGARDSRGAGPDRAGSRALRPDPRGPECETGARPGGGGLSRCDFGAGGTRAVGAGTGATAAKWRGFEHRRPGGIGSAVRVGGGCHGRCAGCGQRHRRRLLGLRRAAHRGTTRAGAAVDDPRCLFTNTTLVVLATDGHWIASSSHVSSSGPTTPRGLYPPGAHPVRRGHRVRRVMRGSRGLRRGRRSCLRGHGGGDRAGGPHRLRVSAATMAPMKTTPPEFEALRATAMSCVACDLAGPGPTSSSVSAIPTPGSCWSGRRRATTRTSRGSPSSEPPAAPRRAPRRDRAWSGPRSTSPTSSSAGPRGIGTRGPTRSMPARAICGNRSA